MSANPDEPTRSTRDLAETRVRLQDWLRSRLPDKSGVELGELWTPDGSGMSSETLLFNASWSDDGGPRDHALVARVAPDPADVPVFPAYDLDLQFKIMTLVSEASAVPLPAPRWNEPDSTHLGAPFFVMDRISGRVPADIPPYTFEGWLFDASPKEQEQLQHSSIDVLVNLHDIDVTAHDVDFLLAGDSSGDPGETALRRHFQGQRELYDWARKDRRHPVLEAAFGWLEANWPAATGADVIVWGDSRIGNIMYDGFTPTAVFDWEMATLGPRAMDIGWMTFMHTFFQEIAVMMELPGLPQFMRRADAAAYYSQRSGHPVDDLEWFQVYAALRHGIIMTRITERQVHFGEAEWSDDVDSAIPHREVILRMLDGTWWDR